ncbi:MAG TPA: DinB family protein [Gemmatimonadales bacterium]|nr:DinB family protein [Gemmatimonadales bacterium]
MTSAERQKLIRQYAAGPAKIKAALAQVPAEALQWRPGPGKWSVHEIVIHCADSEVQAHTRIRTLLADADPIIHAYDQDRWAVELDYHRRPLAPALATIEAVRANTVALLESLTDQQWARTGRHTESGPYSAEKWVTVYAIHLDRERHEGQILRNLEAWRKASGKA